MKSWISTALAVTALAATLMGGPAAADEGRADKIRQITSREVTPAETAAAFPKAAFDQKISGGAVLNCTADNDGREVDCRIIKEDPPGMGFGEAALALVTKERVKTKDASGTSIVGRRFNTGFNFLAPGDSNPDWVRKPSGADVAAAFPTKAMQEGRAGKATITCNVTIEGFLERCVVLSESPEAYGFGAAALQLAPQFRMSPKMRGGKPVSGGEVSIPISWQAPSGGNESMFGSRRLMIDPPWSTVPTFEQVRAVWPQDAKGLDAGQAALRCAVGGDGTLKDCDVISEIPKGKGFGRAAKTLSRDFRINLRPEDAKLVRDLSVDVPFRFRDPALPDPRRLTNPRWTTVLSPEGMASVYPAAAIKAGVFKGLGVASCSVDAWGRLIDCTAKREDPAALDFGAAAVAAAKLMAMNPWTKEGDTVDGMHLTLPIAFNYEPDPTAPPPAKP